MIILLSTRNKRLNRVWHGQLAAYAADIHEPENLRQVLEQPGPKVWILDAADPSSSITPHRDTACVLVGEPESVIFQEIRRHPWTRVSITYEQSRETLAGYVPLVVEVAEKSAALDTLRAKQSAPAFPFKSDPKRDKLGADLSFLVNVVRFLDDPGRLREEFSQAFRTGLNASTVEIQLEQEADANELTRWVARHPAAINLDFWNGCDDPILENRLRQILLLRGTSLLLPVPAPERKTSWVELGPRSDGFPFSPANVEHGMFLGAVLHDAICKQESMRKLSSFEKTLAVREERLPFWTGTEAEVAAANIPTFVKNRLYKTIETRQGTAGKTEKTTEDLFIITGFIGELGMLWAVWERVKDTKDRQVALTQLASVVGHVMRNRLTSIKTFLHVLSKKEGLDLPLDSINDEVGHLETLGNTLSQLEDLGKKPLSETDLNELVKSILEERDIKKRLPASPTVVQLPSEEISFMLNVVLDRVEEARNGHEMSLDLESRGDETRKTVLMRVGGFPPNFERKEAFAPDNGSIENFLAWEILRSNNGKLHFGPSSQGDELQIQFDAEVE